MMKIAVFILCLFVLNGSYAASDPFEHLNNLGFAPTLTKPADFSAELSSGQEKALSSYKGKWILLSFWATWCGPCREEMPMLEKLHKKFFKSGLRVLGVSIDKPGSKKDVSKFLKRNRITFPTFLDPESKIAKRYFANAVPSLYLISPDWKLIGIVRGAKDWSGSATTKELASLLKFKTISENEKVLSNSFSLPENLVPPILKSSLSKNVIRSGETVSLDIFVQWRGRLEQYLFKVPRPHLPNHIKVGDVSSESSQNQGVALLKYTYPLTIEKSGQFDIGPIEMDYKSRLGGGFQSTRAEKVQVYVKPFPWTKIIALIVAFFVFGFLLYYVFMTFKNKKQEGHIHARKNNEKDLLIQEWHQTKARMDKQAWESGQRAGQLMLLKFVVRAYPKLGLSTQEEEKLLDQVQYGNLSLSETQISILKNEVDNNLR